MPNSKYHPPACPQPGTPSCCIHPGLGVWGAQDLPLMAVNLKPQRWTETSLLYQKASAVADTEPARTERPSIQGTGGKYSQKELIVYTMRGL